MKKKCLIKQAGLLAGVMALGMSSAFAATVSSAALNLQWAGSVPVSPVAGAWKFVNMYDPTRDFVPTVGNVIVTTDRVNQGAKILETTLVEFGIKTTASTDFFTDGSPVNAYLVNDVAFSGLSGATAQPTMKIKAGSTELRVGSANAVAVNTVSGATTDFIPLSLRGTGTLPSGSFNDGDNFNVQATVMFSASIG